MFKLSVRTGADAYKLLGKAASTILLLTLASSISGCTRSRSANSWKTQARAEALATAVKRYIAEFGKPPAGNTGAITAALLGGNPHKLSFIAITPDMLNS